MPTRSFKLLKLLTNCFSVFVFFSVKGKSRYHFYLDDLENLELILKQFSWDYLRNSRNNFKTKHCCPVNHTELDHSRTIPCQFKAWLMVYFANSDFLVNTRSFQSFMSCKRTNGYFKLINRFTGL